MEILFLFIFKILFIHEREAEAEAQVREKQAPWGEPDVGLHPGTLGSHPEPKADAQLLSHPGISYFKDFYLGARRWLSWLNSCLQLKS